MLKKVLKLLVGKHAILINKLTILAHYFPIFAIRSLKAGGGYTFHQHYDKLGLINMNRRKGAHDNTAKINHRVGVTFGRVYDPIVGRFLSVDPLVGNPLSAQDYNGYSYCANNPMKYTDPSGYTYWQYKDGEWSHFEYHPFQNGSANFREAASGGSNLRYGYEGPGQGRNGTGLSGYYYDWFSGSYRTTAGSRTPWSEVYYNAVVPNAVNIYTRRDILAEKKDPRNQPAMPGWPKLVPSNKTLIDFAKKFFGQYKYLDIVRLIYDDVLTSEKKDIANVDNQLYEGKYNIFFSTYAFNSSWQLFMTMGHEFVHVANFIENPGISVDQNEWASYNYEAILCKNIGFKGGELYYNGRATEWYDGTPRGKYWVYDKWGLPTKYPGY